MSGGPRYTRRSMYEPAAPPDAAEASPRYLFIVARDRPDIFARVTERLQGDPRIEVIVDRRYGERRQSAVSPAVERRHGDRRHPMKFWDDLTVHPTLVVPRRAPSATELHRDAATAARDAQHVRAENGTLRDEIADLEQRIATLSSANQELCADNNALRGQIASLRARIDALVSADEALRAAAARLCAEIGNLQASFGALAQRLMADPKVTGRRIP